MNKENELLKNEIDKIVDDLLRSMTRDIIQVYSEDLYNMPATFTGKYHPAEERGPGGLVLHIARMSSIVNAGLCTHLSLTDREADLLRVAVILHDIGRVKCFKRNRFGQFINLEKGLDGHEWKGWKEIISPFIEKAKLTNLETTQLKNMIERHMGSWVGKNIPETKLDLALSILDYVDSRENVHIDVFGVMKKLKTSIIGVRLNIKKPVAAIKKLKHDLVLEIGCGNGRNLIFSSSVGIDLDPEILRRQNNVVLADGQNLPFRSGVFELAIHCYSLEFMKDQNKAVIEAKRISKEYLHLKAPSKRIWKDLEQPCAASLE